MRVWSDPPMLESLRIPPWPPELEPGETILAEGSGSRRRLRRSLLGTVLVGLVAVLVIGVVADGFFPPIVIWMTPIMTLAANVVLSYRMEQRHLSSMLTTERFVQQGKGHIPRSEIGAVTVSGSDVLFGFPGRSVILHRSGQDMLLRGPKFRLDYLEDPKGFRDELERLK